MPLGRYFVFVGGFLLALILLVDWHVPQIAAQSTASDVDRSTIRIHSAHRWPSAVVFDTTQPTIVPPPQPVLAETEADKSLRRQKALREALARARDAEVPPAAASPAPPRHFKRHVRVARAPAARVASYDTFGFRPFFQPGW